jgi:GTP cyclohydrolase II
MGIVQIAGLGEYSPRRMACMCPSVSRPSEPWAGILVSKCRVIRDSSRISNAYDRCAFDTLGSGSYKLLTVEIVAEKTVRIHLERYASAEIPTTAGSVRVVVYRDHRKETTHTSSEHVALIVGDISQDLDDVMVRVHSECITSEVFGSIKCDCRDQFDSALAKLRKHGCGILVYLRQEGRGIGLGNKIRAYELQAKGFDTVDANHQLGFETDLRTYDIAGEILRDLGVTGVTILTNNPDKVEGLASTGIAINNRLPCEVPSNHHSEQYLATKRERCGHLLELL